MNYSLLENEDENDLLALSDAQDDSPYSSLSDRKPVDDLDLDGMSNPSSPSVKDVISSRQSRPEAPQLSPSPPLDPLLQNYEEGRKELGQFRNQAQDSNRGAMIAQLVSQAARGSAPIDSSSNNDLFKNVATQQNQLLKSKQEDLEQRQKVLSAIEGRKSREGIASENRLGREFLAKEHNLDRKATMASNDKNKQDRMNSINIARVNSLYTDPGINRETTKLNASRSAQTLIDAVKKGEIKGSKNIRNQLTTIMSTIEMGGPGAVADRQAMGVDNLYTKAKDALAFIDSHPNDSIPAQYLDQLEIESHALGDRAAANYSNLSKSKLSGADLSGGDPSIDPGQIHRLATQRKNTFLQSNGYDPETALPMNRKEITSPKKGAGSPGGLVRVRGKLFRIGQDGDSLEEVM